MSDADNETTVTDSNAFGGTEREVGSGDQETSSNAGRRTRRARGLRPRTIAAIAFLILLVAAALFWWLLKAPNDGSVELLPPSPDATSTITYAGMFPAAGDPPLVGPIGVSVDSTRVYVCESDRGDIREFADNGRRMRTLAVPKASGATTFYPTDIAVLGNGRLAVVDTAARRVVILSVSGTPGPLTLKPTGANSIVRNPTAVARLGNDCAVFDSADGRVKVFTVDGAFRFSFEPSVTPRVVFAGGMTAPAGDVWLTDLSGGRVVRTRLSRPPRTAPLPLRLVTPRGIAVGPAGTLLVAESLGRDLLHLDQRGTVLARVSTSAIPSEGQLDLPRGCAWMAATSRLYVVDNRAGRVKVYNVTARAPRAP
jgi:hypothetical protein